MFPHGRASHVQRPERAELALPQGSKQPREIGSQLDGTKGTAGKRRHRFQKERVRGFKEAYLGGDIALLFKIRHAITKLIIPKKHINAIINIDNKVIIFL